MAQRPPCRPTVTKKGLTHTLLVWPELGSVSLVTTKTIANLVIRELGLVLPAPEDKITGTRVEMKHWGSCQTMERNTSKQTATFLFNEAWIPVIDQYHCTFKHT